MKKSLKSFSFKHGIHGFHALVASATFTIFSAATPVSAIVNGRDDLSSNSSEMRQRNATVFVSTGCTGTLITRWVVLTAGHCGVEPNTSTAGEWVRATQNVQISVGPDKTNPQFKTKVAFVNYSGSLDAVMVGLKDPVPSDIATPIRALTITASDAARRNPDSFWRSQQFRIAGWGDTNPASDVQTANIRQTALLNYQALPCDGHPMVMCALGIRRVNGIAAGVGAGDSGGPVYWTDRGGQTWVIGVLQQPRRAGGGGGARFTITFDKRGELKQEAIHGDVPIGLSTASWLHRAASSRPPQEQYNGSSRSWPNWDIPDMVRAFNWWSPSRKDNFLTTDPRWSAPTREPENLATWNKGNGTGQLRRYLERNSYWLFRVEGFMFNPKRPQPPGTVPVFSWWSSGRGDNFATTKPSWSMPVRNIRWSSGSGEHIINGPQRGSYKLYRLEGFIYDPARPQPSGTIPLYSWWSDSNKDNFATTQMSWRLTTSPELRGPWAELRAVNSRNEELASVHVRHRSGYRIFRLEGYMPVTRKPR